MPDRPVPPSARPGAVRARVLRTVERRPVGTNGYVSTWGAIMGVRPPKGR